MKYSFLIILALLGHTLTAQLSNDDCSGAINIPSIDEYCSGELEFSTVGSMAEPPLDEVGTTVGCFITHENGVWFAFTPTEPAVSFYVFGQALPNQIARTNLSLYTGNCNSLTFVECSRGISNENDFLVNGLTLGQTYYLLVETEEGDIDFTLCINDFIAPKPPESDCNRGVILCDKTAFQIESLFTEGDITNEFAGFENACLTTEFNSVWYRWTCEDSGTLTFDLIPNNYIPGFESDDLDFALFELPGGIDDCNGKRMIRCMASGANGSDQGTDPFDTWSECNGPTGLSTTDTDTEEAAGCQSGNNNYVQNINMVAGTSYALVVMNFSESGLGFSIEFDGTGTFRGPEPGFDLSTDVNIFECDKKIEVLNTSTSTTDPIANYAWNFGAGSIPPNQIGEGPHIIEFESFGKKSITLTVESSKGCIVTKIIDVEVESCCDDFPDLGVATTPFNVQCNGESNGAILVSGIAGNPDYKFSIDGGPFIPNTSFNELPAGEYDITIQDIKGCETTVPVTINEPPPILTDSGPDITVDLGFDGQINATYSPIKPGDIIQWSPIEGLSCTDCLDPVVIPPGTTTYTMTVTDANGCTSEAVITVVANLIRPIYFPNVITPTTNDNNSIGNLGVGRQVEIIEELTVFDRWGSIVYSCNDILPNDNSRGWDGRFGTCDDTSFSNFVTNGVYVWMAKVRFIDNEVIIYSNDVTVLK